MIGNTDFKIVYIEDKIDFHFGKYYVDYIVENEANRLCNCQKVFNTHKQARDYIEYLNDIIA